jgi:two-component system uhpT operon response regulator UhpA
MTDTGIRIWVVDDDEDFRFLFSKLLSMEMENRRLQDFGSARDLLAALKTQPAPEIILMDVNMPEMSGIEAIPLIHQLAPKTRVLMVSVFMDEAKRRQALANGAVNFLRKGCTPLEITAAIGSALRQPSATDIPNASKELQNRLPQS